MESLRTTLWDRHRRLGAKMGPFAGWDMPIRYPDGIIAEHRHTRHRASVFDTCHMGEIRVRGAAADVCLDGIMARPVVGQMNGTCRYNFLMDAGGGIADDLIVYRIGADEFLLVVNAGTRAADVAVVVGACAGRAAVTDESGCTGKLDLQGPETAIVLDRLGLHRDELPRYFRWAWVVVDGRRFLVSRTGYTGELGFEFYGPDADIGALWDLLLEQPGVAPAGLGARDTLRLEMGYPLYGHELDRSTSPQEAGFADLVATSGRTFVGCCRRGGAPSRRLTGFLLDGRRAARHGDSILSPTGERLGTVTSGAYAPTLDRAVALGYVSAAWDAGVGAPVVFGGGGGRELIGSTAAVPFYAQGTVRAVIGESEGGAIAPR